jgi:signal transduction histidine kinase/DNA-binding response OmpR family regulator
MTRLVFFCLKKLSRKIACFLGWLLVGTSAISAAVPVVIDSDFESVTLRSQLSYLEDADGQLSLEQVLSPEVQELFEENPDQVFSKGRSDSIYWLTFSVKNNKEDDFEPILKIDNSYRLIEVFHSERGGDFERIHKKDLDQMLHEGSTNQDLFHFPIILKGGSESVFILRLEGNLVASGYLSIWEEDELIASNNSGRLSLGFNLGFLGVAFILSLSVFFLTKDKAFLFYSLFLLFFSIYSLISLGFVFHFFSSLNLANWTSVYSLFGVLACAYLFSNSFLRVDALSLRSNQVREVARWLLAGSLAISVFLSLSQAFEVFLILGVALAPLTFFVGIDSWRQGNAAGGFYLLGWGGFLALVTLSVAHTLGGFQLGDTPYYLLELGSLFEASVFAIGLTYRLKDSYLQRDQAREDLIASLREKDRFKSNLLANASHELKTPLQGVLGLTESALGEISGRGLEPAEQSLSMALFSGKRLQLLIENLLDLTAIQGHRLQIESERFSMHTLIEESLGLVQIQFALKSVDFVNRVPRELPQAWGDPSRLSQVLNNLLFNAGKFTQQGKVEVRSRVQGETLRLEVHDSGEGVPPEQRESIFERFHQNSPEQTEGLGLGLSISREIIVAHGGRIGVEDSPLGGALFWFEVSQAPPQAQARASQLAQPLPSASPDQLLLEPQAERSSQRSIAVVDDDVINLYTMMRQLQGLDLAVSCFSSAVELLDTLGEDNLPELILLDVMMPDLDGFELCELLRERFSKEELPILFLTALHRPQDVAQGFEVGGNDYLAKPFQQEELLIRVAAQLELKAFRQAGKRDTESRSSERELLVQTLNLALTAWREATGKDAVEFAQTSRLWGCHLDKQTGYWRTRSLTQYLSVSTLPVNPRWRKVAQSGEFALSQIDKTHPQHAPLSEALLQLYQAFQART